MPVNRQRQHKLTKNHYLCLSLLYEERLRLYAHCNDIVCRFDELRFCYQKLITKKYGNC